MSDSELDVLNKKPTDSHGKPIWENKTQRIKVAEEEISDLIKQAYAAQSKQEKNSLYKDAIDMLLDVEADKKTKKGDLYAPALSDIYWMISRGFNSFQNKRSENLIKKVGKEAFNEFKKVFDGESNKYLKISRGPIDVEDDELAKKHKKDEEKLKPAYLKHKEFDLIIQKYIQKHINDGLQIIQDSNLSAGAKAWYTDGLENLKQHYDGILKKYEDKPDFDKIKAEIEKEHQENHDFLTRALEKAKENPVLNRNQITSLNKEMKRINRELESKLKDIPDFIQKFNKLKDVFDQTEPSKNTQEKTRTDKFAFQDDINSGKSLGTNSLNSLNNISKKYNSVIITLLKKLKKIIDTKEYDNLFDAISDLIENMKLSYLPEITMQAKQELKEFIKEKYEDQGAKPDKNLQVLEELSNKTPLYFERGLKDYFYYVAGKLVKSNKSKIDSKNFEEVKQKTKEKMINFCNNLFLPVIIRPVREDIAEIRKYLITQKKDLFQNRSVTILTKFLNDEKTKEYSKEEKKEIDSKKDADKSSKKTNYYFILSKFLNILKPKQSDVYLTRRIKNLEKYISEHYYEINMPESMIKDFEEIYSKNKDKGISDEKQIREYLGKIQFYCKSLNVDNDPDKERSAKKIKTPKLSGSEDGFVQFHIRRRLDTEINRSLGDYVYDPKQFYIKRNGKTEYVNYIDYVKYAYPKDLYEYVDYRPMGIKGVSFHNEKEFKDEAGETLALYDRDKNLITDGNWHRAVYVKLKNV